MNAPTSSHTTSDSPGRSAAGPPIHFGPFTLYCHEHVLMSGGAPVAIGKRALDLLICMATRPGELLEKYELIAMAWPRTVVAECNLRAQIVAVRRALKDKDPHNEYVTTVAGRGYRFIAHNAHNGHNAPNAEPGRPDPLRASPIPPKPLPAAPASLVGREPLIARLTEQLRRSRFITLTGAGGVGKTTVALEVARRVQDEYPDGVLLFELFDYLRLEGILATLTEELGLQANGHANLGQLFGQLGECRRLLVIDNCEQAVGAVAKLVENLLRWAPNCAVLATSREALQADGEMVERIEPLALEPTDGEAHAPATALFLQRVHSLNPTLDLSSAQHDVVAAICRKLNGMPLEIELAAESAATLPLEMLAPLLDMDFRLQMHSERSCVRHQSLRASLDWSFNALTADEQQVFCLMAVFKGSFTLNAVLAMVADDTPLKPEQALTALDRLVDKSLLTAQKGAKAYTYQLLETTRLYGVEKLQQSGQFQRVCAKQAAYAMSVLQAFAERLDASAPEAWKHLYGAESETVKSALSWAVSDKGNQLLGFDLTLAALGITPKETEPD